MNENSFFKNVGRNVSIVTKLISPSTYNIISGKYIGRDGDYIMVEDAFMIEIVDGKEKSRQKIGNVAVNKSIVALVSFF